MAAAKRPRAAANNPLQQSFPFAATRSAPLGTLRGGRGAQLRARTEAAKPGPSASLAAHSAASDKRIVARLARSPEVYPPLEGEQAFGGRAIVGAGLHPRPRAGRATSPDEAGLRGPRRRETGPYLACQQYEPGSRRQFGLYHHLSVRRRQHRQPCRAGAQPGDMSPRARPAHGLGQGDGGRLAR